MAYFHVNVKVLLNKINTAVVVQKSILKTAKLKLKLFKLKLLLNLKVQPLMAPVAYFQCDNSGISVKNLFMTTNS